MKAGRDRRRLLAGSAPETVDPGPPMLDDLNGPAEVFLGPGPETLVVGIGPHQQDCREQEMEAGEQEPAAGLVVEVGRVELDLEQVALGVDQHRALAALDLLAAVVAAR